VFVGNRPIDKIEDLSNVIISRNYEGNLEDYPQLTSFTGWYTLWKHNLIDSEYVNLFEYDIDYVPDFETNMYKFYYEKSELIDKSNEISENIKYLLEDAKRIYDLNYVDDYKELNLKIDFNKKTLWNLERDFTETAIAKITAIHCKKGKKGVTIDVITPDQTKIFSQMSLWVCMKLRFYNLYCS
jgi:hypothetical protein